MIQAHLIPVTLLLATAATPIVAWAEGVAQPPPAPSPATVLFKHVHIDFKKKTIDLDARVVLREGDWVELLACAPRSREHESIVVVLARPRAVHAALLAIGLVPGSPTRWDWNGDQVTVIPPRGPKVAVTMVYEKDGKTVDIPANEWIIDRGTDKPLEDNHWLFTGSKLLETDGKTEYQADIEGNILSVVSFGDEVLARPTSVSNKNDAGAYGIRTEKIPPLKTPLKVRLTPIPPKKGPKNPTPPGASGSDSASGSGSGSGSKSP